MPSRAPRRAHSRHRSAGWLSAIPFRETGLWRSLAYLARASLPVHSPIIAAKREISDYGNDRMPCFKESARMRVRQKTLSGNLKRRVEPLSSAPQMGNPAASHLATCFQREVDCSVCGRRHRSSRGARPGRATARPSGRAGGVPVRAHGAGGALWLRFVESARG